MKKILVTLSTILVMGIIAGAQTPTGSAQKPQGTKAQCSQTNCDKTSCDQAKCSQTNCDKTSCSETTCSKPCDQNTCQGCAAQRVCRQLDTAISNNCTLRCPLSDTLAICNCEYRNTYGCRYDGTCDTVKFVPTYYPQGFYIVASGALSLGTATFRSTAGPTVSTSGISNQSFFPGFDGRLAFGYRFNRFLSVELSATLGNVNTHPMDCCANEITGDGWLKDADKKNVPPHAYWMSAQTGQTCYFSDGTDGWYYADLTASTFLRKYMLQANLNLLGIANSTRGSRLAIELSPRIGLGRTSVTHRGTNSLTALTTSPKSLEAKRKSLTHFVYGGELSVSFAIDPSWYIGIYGGIDFLTGERFDGTRSTVRSDSDLPNPHYENFVYEGGLKLTYSFGKRSAQKGKARSGCASCR